MKKNKKRTSKANKYDEDDHGHSHGNHSHLNGDASLKSSILMILIGDGLHNFRSVSQF
jgi:hypothetical protein